MRFFFQEQQGIYAAIQVTGGHWDLCIFLNWRHSLNLIGPVKGILKLKLFIKLTPSCHFCLWGVFLASSSLYEVGGQKHYAHVKTFEQIQWNKVFCRMYGLSMIEVISPSGQMSNIVTMHPCILEFKIEKAVHRHCEPGKKRPLATRRFLVKKRGPVSLPGPPRGPPGRF